MNHKQYLFHVTGIVTIGQFICCSAMVGVFALLGKFDLRVLLGSAMGGLISLSNFFIMGLCASFAADKAVNQDIRGGQVLISMSYLGRLAGLFALLTLCAKSGMFHLITLILPLIFTRPILTAAEFFRTKGGNDT